MQKHMLKCPACVIYTLNERCPKCGIPTVNPKPAKFSPDDKYSSYRRQVKKDLLVKQGFI